MPTLKACPFCGGKAEFIEFAYSFLVQCTSMDSCFVIPQARGLTKDLAAQRWNQRPALQNSEMERAARYPS